MATLELWYQALTTPYGIEVDCSPSLEQAKTKLYNLKRDAKDPILDRVGLTPSPFDPLKLWLKLKEPNDETS